MKPLVDDGALVIGLDSSEAMIERARASLAGSDSSRFELEVADFVHWPSAGGVFDLVYSPYHTLSHLMDWRLWEELFVNVFDHLRPGGRFAFSAAVPVESDIVNRNWTSMGQLDFEGLSAEVRTRLNQNWSERTSSIEVKGLVEGDGETVEVGRWTFDLRLAPEVEIKELALRSGFVVETCSGSYEEANAPRVVEQVWVLARPAA